MDAHLMGFTRRQWVALLTSLSVGIVGVVITSTLFPSLIN